MDKIAEPFCAEHNITEAQYYGKEKIKGDLNLRGLASIPEGFNPTVGGGLLLSRLTSIPEGFNFKATDEAGVYYGNMNEPVVISWQNGRYRLIDGVFCEVISTYKNIIKAKRIASTEHFDIVTDGVNFSHIFEAWTLDTVVTLKDAIHSYCAITGACDVGVKMFAESLEEVPQQISVRKIIELAHGKYGYEAYRDFFKV